MVITKNCVNEIFRTVLVLSALISTASAVDCNGKSFSCVNSTHFMICVDLGGGVSQAIDDFFIACPPPTVCQGTNQFECEFPAPTTPSTTLTKVISETTLPWEEVVTASSPGNAYKEFSENYLNTERITTTVEFSVTTDAAVDITAATSSELYVNNELNTTDSAVEITTATIETTPTVNENLNIIEYVPTVETADITTAAVETIRQTPAESKNLTDMEPAIVEETTTPAVHSKTENIIITDTKVTESEDIVPSVTKQVIYTIHENLNITEKPKGIDKDNTTTIIKPVMQTTVKNGNLSETENVAVNEITATAIEITTDNISKAGPLGAELGYIEPTDTGQGKPTTNYNLLELVNVQSNTEPSQVTILPQNVSAKNNVLLKEPSMEHTNSLTIEKAISSKFNNITATNTEVPISKITNATKTENVVPDILPVQTTATVEAIVETTTVSIEHLTTISVDRIADDFTKVPPLGHKFQKTEAVNISHEFEESVRSNNSIVVNKKPFDNKIGNQETQMPKINNPGVPDSSATSISSTTSQVAKENVKYTITNKTLHEKDYTTITNVPTDQNPAETTVFNGVWTETVDNVTSTDQPTTINEETDATQKFVTENIVIPTSQAVILEMITTDVVPTTVSNAQPIATAFEDNMMIETPSRVTENIVSTVNNGNSTNDLVTEQSVNMDTITTEYGVATVHSVNMDTTTTAAMDIPTTNSNVQSMPSTIEDNMKIESPSPVTENIVSAVNNGASTDGVVTVHSVNMDTTTTEAMDIATTISNVLSMPSTIEDNMKIETPSPVTENIVSAVNNGASTNDIVTVQSVNMDTTTTEAMDIATTISNVLSMPSTIEDNMKIETASPVTENIVSAVNKGASTNGVVTVQSVNMNTITTEAMDIATTNNNVQSMPSTIEVNMKIETPSPVTENIVSAVNNGASTNDLVTVQSVNMDTITTEAMDIFTTISNVQLMPPTIEDNMKAETPSPVTENIVSSVNNGASTNGVVTIQSVNMNTIATEAMDIATTYSNVQSMPSTIEDNMKIETPSPVAENIVSALNNGASTTGVVTVQSVNMDTITTEAVDIPTKISNVQSMPPTFEDNMKIETPSPVTENIVSTVNNGASTNGVMKVQSVDMDTVITEAVNIPTTTTNALSMPPTFKDNMNIESPLPVTENIVTTVNNGASTNGLVTVKVINMDTLTTEARPTTMSNAQPMSPDFEDNMKTERPLSNENIVSTENNKVDTNDFMSIKELDLDIINTHAMYTPTTTVTNGQAPTFEDNMKTEAPLPATVNIVSSVNDGASTNKFTTALPVNVDVINTEAMYIPNTTNNGQPMPPTFEGSKRTDVLSSVINGVSTNGLKAAQPVNLDIVNKEAMYIQTTNIPSTAPTFKDIKTTEASFPATKNIVSTINSKYSTNGFMTAETIDSETQKAEFETGVQLTTDTYTVPVTNVIELSFNNEKILETDHEGSPENATSVPDIIEDSPENAIQKTQIILNSSTNTAMESDVNGNYDHNKVTTISTNYMIETEDIRGQLLSDLELSLNNTHNSTTIFIGVENTENTLSSNAHNNQDAHNISIINTVTKHEKAILENVNAPVSVDNVATSQTETTINNNIVIATTIKSTPTLGLDSAFDISNQNSIRQQGDSKTKQFMTNLQPSIVEHNAQANNIIWNPLANHVLDNSNLNSESVGTSSVTNINAEVNDRITATLNTKLASQQTTTSVTTGSPIYANTNDRKQNIDSITTERSSSRSTVVEIETSLRKSGNNTEVYTDNLEDINTKSNHDPSIVSISITSDNKPEAKSYDIKDGYIISPIIVHNNQFNFPTNSDGSTETNRVGTPMDANKVNEEDDTLSKPEMLDVLPLPINIKFSSPITNIPIFKDLTSKSQAENTVIVRTRYIATVPTIEGTAFDTQTSDFITKNGDAIFNSQTRSIDGTDVISQPSLHVEKVPNKKASAPINAYVRPESKPSGTSTNTDNPYNIHSQTFTNNVKTGTITPESVSESNYESHKPENITDTVSHVDNNLNKQVPTDTAPTYSCINGIRGRYSDKNDCKKFYICIGNSELIVGHCPENTVFSDLKKLCTRNMSHCIRDNQFKCPSVGRFSDFMKDDIYYICVNHNSKLYRLKFQCQKGYILDKETVKCIETKEIESNESVSISSSDNISQTSSSTSSKSISSSSTSNGSSRVDDSSSKDNNSYKSKKSNKAQETSEKSEGNEDEDDEVFKCKTKGKFPIPNECRRYYLCKKNRKSEYRRKIKKCDSGKVFDKNEKKCVDDDSYEC